MKILIVNGSPRYKKSNSNVLVQHFIQGIENSKTTNEIHCLFLQNKTDFDQAIQILPLVDHLICIHPLYTDSMPGIVKEFIEKLYLMPKQQHLKIGFIVHSGFPEGIHSTFIAKYYAKLSQRLGYEYLGTIIKGGTEGIRLHNSKSALKTCSIFETLGENFALNRTFDETIKQKLEQPYIFPAYVRYLLVAIRKFINRHWKQTLKQNGALSRSYDQPFIQK